MATLQVVGQPDIELTATNKYLDIGKQTTLVIDVSNGGVIDRGGPAQLEQQVTTARSIVLDLEEDSNLPITSKSGPVALANLVAGQQKTASFEIEIDEDAPPGSYDVPIEVSYVFTRLARYDQTATPPGYTNVEYDDISRTSTYDVEIVIESSPRFEIVSRQMEPIAAGDTGRLDFRITNVGTIEARDARIHLSSENPAVFLGGPSNPQASSNIFVTRLSPGESYDAAVLAGADPDTVEGSYPVSAVVSYADPDGFDGVSERIPFGVTIGPQL
ncbi:MAG: hypothetical protein R3324_07125, partial [Halobacteriales archaeon]|nr:hypothetical protein [Halobacteriales archaeon]